MTRRRGCYEARHPSLLVALLSEEPDLSRRHERALVRRLFEFWLTSFFAPVSARRVQAEAVRFLQRPIRGRLAEEVTAELRRWFVPRPSDRIRWDRLQAAARPGYTESEVWARAVAGPLPLAFPGPLPLALPDILKARGLDPTGLTTFYRGADDWRLRFMEKNRAR